MVFAAILAGGIGKRLNCQEPKQFLKIHGIPILAHSIEKFVRVDEFKKIIISSPKEYINETQELVNNYFPLDKRLIVIEGGVERRDTILNSIDYVRNVNGQVIQRIRRDPGRQRTGCTTCLAR